MDATKFIYATNRSQVIYKFRIIEITDTEYIVNDAETTSYELSQVKFYINKENLCQARCEEKVWEFIVTEDFFASFELNDVKKEFYKRQISLIENCISVNETALSKLEILHNQKVKKPFNTFFSFNDFKLGDTLYVLYDKKLYETNVVSFVTLDKCNFVPNIKTDFSNAVEDYVELRQRKNGELFIEIADNNYDYVDYKNCQVFLSRMDYDLYLEMLEYEKEIERINDYRISIKKHKKDLEKYNNLYNEL
jgi:hypothetical protein